MPYSQCCYGFTLLTAHIIKNPPIIVHNSLAVHWRRPRSGNLARVHPSLSLGHARRKWSRSKQRDWCWSSHCFSRSRSSLKVFSSPRSWVHLYYLKVKQSTSYNYLVVNVISYHSFSLRMSYLCQIEYSDINHILYLHAVGIKGNE